MRDSLFAILTLPAKMREIPFDDAVIGLAELRVVRPRRCHEQGLLRFY
jgi:hypothetical protein